MRFLKLILSVAVLTLLGACATAPSMQAAIPQNTIQSGLEISHSTLLDENNHMLQPVNSEKNILYFQNFGGGGVAVGLLLGPFGVAANGEMIKSNTMNDVNLIKGKLTFKPQAIFIAAAKNENVDVTENQDGSKTKVSPYIYISKTEGEKLLIASAVIIERGEGKSKFVGKYMYQLPITTNINELSKLDDVSFQKFEAAISEGYKQIISKITNEQATSTNEKKITFKSELLNPRFDFEMVGNLIESTPNVTWIRTFGGVFGVQNTNINYKLAQK